SASALRLGCWNVRLASISRRCSSCLETVTFCNDPYSLESTFDPASFGVGLGPTTFDVSRLLLPRRFGMPHGKQQRGGYASLGCRGGRGLGGVPGRLESADTT